MSSVDVHFEDTSTMKRFRYFSNSHNLDSLLSQSRPSFHAPIFLPKTLASHEPSSGNFLNSNRFHTKSACYSVSSLISSIGSSAVCASAAPSSQKLQSLHLYTSGVDKGLFVNLYLLKDQYHGRFQAFSTASSDAFEPPSPPGASGSDEKHGLGNVGIDGIGPTSKQVLEIVGMIRRGENDLASKLNSMNVSLSIASIAQIFQVLNSEKVSALCLFDWIKNSQPISCYGNDICSLVIDNCGRLDDYHAMLHIMNDFRSAGICLTRNAFEFISVSSSKKASVIKVVEVLNEVGGSCRPVGLLSLIEMLSVKGSFKMAEFVMKITERKRSYYNIMIRESCRRRNFGRAIDMLDEMRQVGCDPDSKTYNYILSSLYKNYKSAVATKLFEQMLEMNCSPDEITYEILICYSCKVGNFDFARKLLDSMVLKGIKPRLTSHAAFVKGYFNLRRYKEAYEHVVDSSVKYSCFSNSVYSLLARLYMNEGNVVIAQNILIDMINKGLKPDFAVYTKVLKELSKTGRTGLAEDLSSRFCSLA